MARGWHEQKSATLGTKTSDGVADHREAVGFSGLLQIISGDRDD